VDTRGGSRIFLVYAGVNAEQECLVEVRQNGESIMTSGGSTVGEVFKPMAPGQIESQGGGTAGDGPDGVSSIVGPVGPGVARVDVEVGDGRSVVASVGPTGWFAAWWPGAVGFRSLTAYDGAGGVTGAAQ
jgi:hypothetical protein